MVRRIAKFERHKVQRGVWPKSLPPLTEEQQRISNDFMKYWHQILPERYGIIERFNHGFPVASYPYTPGCKTLEIGAGIGEHIKYENLSDQKYYCLEIRQNMADEIKKSFPNVTCIVADCQKYIPFPEGFFDRIMAIHVLEHLHNLPTAVSEIHRLLDPEGFFVCVIPCDPGIVYRLGRWVSAERVFKKRYNQSYDWFIQHEHINSPAEIMGVLEPLFNIVKRRFFPFFIPVKDVNLCIGLVLKKF